MPAVTAIGSHAGNLSFADWAVDKLHGVPHVVFLLASAQPGLNLLVETHLLQDYSGKIRGRDV